MSKHSPSRCTRTIERLASLLADFELLSKPGDADSLYVAVDETTVEITVEATRFHGDLLWRAWYYVDANVVRRTTEETVEPTNGRLLECRSVA